MNNKTHTTFETRTTEAIDMSFAAMFDWRRASLLKANDIATETETKVTWMRTRNLFSRLEYLSIVNTG